MATIFNANQYEPIDFDYVTTTGATIQWDTNTTVDTPFVEGGWGSGSPYTITWYNGEVAIKRKPTYNNNDRLFKQ